MKDKPEKYQGARKLDAWTKFIEDKMPVVVEEEVKQEEEKAEEVVEKQKEIKDEL